MHGHVFAGSLDDNKKELDSMLDNGYKLRGRKLILNWGKLKVELVKLPYACGIKDTIFDLQGSPVVLANVYEGPDGKLVDEYLGKPVGIDSGFVEGFDIATYFSEDCFWKTPSEDLSGTKVECQK